MAGKSKVRSERRVANATRLAAALERDPVTHRFLPRNPKPADDAPPVDPPPPPKPATKPAPKAGGDAPAPTPFHGLRARWRRRSE